MRCPHEQSREGGSRRPSYGAHDDVDVAVHPHRHLRRTREEERDGREVGEEVAASPSKTSAVGMEFTGYGAEKGN